MSAGPLVILQQSGSENSRRRRETKSLYCADHHSGFLPESRLTGGRKNTRDTSDSVLKRIRLAPVLPNLVVALQKEY